MTVPPQEPLPRDREQWGTGLPGIPSIWDTAPRAAEPSDRAVPAASPRSPRRRSSARRLVWVGLGLTTLIAAGAAGVGGGETAVVPVPGVAVGVPEPLPPGGPVLLPPPDPPPGPAGVVPLPQPPPPEGHGLVASRAHGAGEPFGLPVGATVVLTDAAAGSRLDVTLLSAVRDGGRLLVDVEVRTPSATGGTVVPALLLRLPDGRELVHTGLTDGQDVPPVLGQGLLWRGTLVFDAVRDTGALVLDDGRALAAWAVPAG